MHTPASQRAHAAREQAFCPPTAGAGGATPGQSLRADVATGADGQSKGFGTVTFASTREAAKAIQALNESEFNGRIIEVRPDAM